MSISRYIEFEELKELLLNHPRYRNVFDKELVEMSVVVRDDDEQGYTPMLVLEQDEVQP